MIRYLLLGGRWGPAPWQFWIALGASCGAAAGLFLALYPWRSGEPWLGGIESGILAVAAVALLAVGLVRRRRGQGPA